MKHHVALIGLTVILFSVSSGSIRAQGPRTVSFQGYLTDENDIPIDGSENVSISLWTEAAGGSEVWTRTYAGLPINDGVFNVILEDGTPSFSELSLQDSLWLAVTVGASPITPRTRLHAAPWARSLSLPMVASTTSASVALVINNSGTGRAADFFSLGNDGILAQTASANGYGGRFFGGHGVRADGTSNDAPDLVLGGSSSTNDDGRIFSDLAYPNSDIWLHSNDAIVMQLDNDSNTVDYDFEIRDNTGTVIFNVDDDGTVTSAGTVAHSSDRNKKEDILAVDAIAILEKVYRLPVSEWRFKGQTSRHVGPMAQDFAEAFDVGADDTHIAGVDADGVALAAIKGLYEVVLTQQQEIERLRRIVEGGE